MYANVFPDFNRELRWRIKMEDEDRMIKKLKEHRDMKLMVREIGELSGIDVRSTVDNDSRGDFCYPKDEEDNLICALDRFLFKCKHRRMDNE